MTFFNPVEGKDIRLRYDPTTSEYVLEQVFIKSANGATFASTLGRLGDDNIGEEVWQEEDSFDNILKAMVAVFSRCFIDNVQVRDLDIQLNPNDPLAIQAKDLLRRVTL